MELTEQHIEWEKKQCNRCTHLHRFLEEGGSCEYSTSRKKYGDVHNSSCAWQGM